MGKGCAGSRSAFWAGIVASTVGAAACSAPSGTSEPLGRIELKASWVPGQQLLAPVGVANAAFGYSVSVDADRIVVGAPFDNDPYHAPPWVGVGSVNVFSRSGSTWSLEQQIFSDYHAPYFGRGVSIAGDTIAVGRFDTTAVSERVSLWVRSGSTWSQQQVLTDPNPGAVGGSNQFGAAIALDGDTLVIGAREDDGQDDNYSNSGAFYIYFRSGTTWSLQKEWSHRTEASAALGYAVALDGDRAVISEPGGRDVQVWSRSASAWAQASTLVSFAGEAGDGFGHSVAVSGDTIAVAAEHDTENGIKSGAVTIYTLSAGTWSVQQKVVPSNATASLQFGRRIALKGDRLLVGTLSTSSYLFERSAGVWTQAQKFTEWPPTTSPGMSVDFDGDTVVMGAPTDTALVSGGGAAYVFRFGDPFAQGTACPASTACASGHCVDGVCCDTACAGGLDDCQACSIAAGGVTDGVCGPRVNGSPCTDGVYCNGTETCTAGVCGNSSGDPCAANVGDDDGDCTESCVEATHLCTGVDPAGSHCNDTVFCNGADTCTATGVCNVHAGSPCTIGDADNDCSESCYESQRSCTLNDPNNTACDDGIACNGTDQCLFGACSTHTTTCSTGGAGGTSGAGGSTGTAGTGGETGGTAGTDTGGSTGEAGTGGTSATGGTSGTGGGGNTATGGAASGGVGGGGAAAAGGTGTDGGAPESGGEGGASGQAGETGAGGTSSNGGAITGGGVDASGGARPSDGGNASGGLETSGGDGGTRGDFDASGHGGTSSNPAMSGATNGAAAAANDRGCGCAVPGRAPAAPLLAWLALVPLLRRRSSRYGSAKQ